MKTFTEKEYKTPRMIAVEIETRESILDNSTTGEGSDWPEEEG